MMVTTLAITIDVPPERIWPWLVQMGWHRGQWYTARWVDRLLFPANRPSADRIVPELQHLSVGDWVPDGPPESFCGFRVVLLEPNRHLVLHSTEHLPSEVAMRFDAWIDWSWAFTLRDLGDGRTRFLLRSRVRLGPWWLAASYWAALIPADYVMARQMLHGIRRRATGNELPKGVAPGLSNGVEGTPSGRIPSAQDDPGRARRGQAQGTFGPDGR